MSAACYLARRGAKTLLLEARTVGAGASGRTGGIVLEGTAKGIFPGTECCVEHLRAVVERERIECELELHGCWEIEHAESSRGFILPWKDDNKYIRVRRVVRGGTVDPMKLVKGLAEAAIRAGAVVRENLPARRIESRDKLRVETDGQTIDADFVVVAANSWTNLLLPNVRPIRSALTLACATEPLSRSTLYQIGLGANIPFYTVDTPYLWGRVMRDGRVIFGAGLVFDSIDKLERKRLTDEEIGARLENLKSRVRALNPALKQVKFCYQWGGPIGIPDDFLPLIGRLPGTSRIFVAAGYAGHGVALSVWAGEAIARAILDNEKLPEWASP